MGDKDWTDVVQTNPRDALRIENNKKKINTGEEKTPRGWKRRLHVHDLA